MAEISLFAAIMMVAGWPIAIIVMFLLIFLIKVTPAMTFFKAWLRKRSIYRVTYRDGLSDFKVGISRQAGTAEIEDGYVMNTEGSHSIDRKSKAPIYDVFGETAFTLNKRYAAIVQRIRQLGYKLNKFGDLQRLVWLASNDHYAEKQKNKIKDPTERQIFSESLKSLREESIDIMPYESINIHDLANMFPFNITPEYIRAKVTNEVMRARKRMINQENILKFMMGGAIVIFVLAIVAIFLFKFVKGPECTPVECTCGVVKTGIEAVKNITM